jgi:hypothetical protein
VRKRVKASALKLKETKIEILIFIHCSIYEIKNDAVVVVVELKLIGFENFPRN